jgi:predicted small lipoprotein YifL
MFIFIRICVILTAIAFLGMTGGCGQTGPLYMPGKPQPIEPKDSKEEGYQSSATQPNSR